MYIFFYWERPIVFKRYLKGFKTPKRFKALIEFRATFLDTQNYLWKNWTMRFFFFLRGAILT